MPAVTVPGGSMRVTLHASRIARCALAAAVALGAPEVSPAQTPGRWFLGVAAGVASKPAYGLSEPVGIDVDLTIGRTVSRRAALRLDAEVQRYGVKDRAYILTPPCLPPGGCVSPQEPGDGAIGTVDVMASAEWYEHPDGRGFYVLGGAGPRMLVAHPDRPRSVRLAVQAGGGVALPVGRVVLLVEGRYLRALGGGAEPTNVVPVSVSLRYRL